MDRCLKVWVDGWLSELTNGWIDGGVDRRGELDNDGKVNCVTDGQMMDG